MERSCQVPILGFSRTLCEKVEKQEKYDLLGECNSLNYIYSRVSVSPKSLKPRSGTPKRGQFQPVSHLSILSNAIRKTT